MPSLPFFKKKEESSSSETPAAETAADAPAATAEPAAEPSAAVDSTPAASEASAPPAVEKTVIEPKRTGFFSRKKSTDGATASESESEGPSSHSRIPSFFGRKAKPAPTVKEDEKENVPEAAPAAAEAAPAAPETETPAAPATEEKKEGTDKIRRRISLFQRRNRADGAGSEPEVTDGEKDAAVKAKRTSFWKTAGAPVAEKEESKEPAPEDPRLVEAKAKVTEASEAEAAAKQALEVAKKNLVDATKHARDAKAAVKVVELEIASELKRARAALKEKKDESKPAEEAAAAPVSAAPPVAPQVTAAA